MEVLGVTSYGDLSQFAQQQSRASAFILSIDDEEFTPGPELDPAVLNLRKFITEIRFKNAEIPIYLYGETRTSSHIPNDILRELHGFIHMFEDTPEFVARHIIREAKSYLDSLAPPFFRALVHYASDGSYSWHCPGHSGGVAFLKSPVGQMFHQFFGENLLRADVCNSVDELGQLLDHSGAGGGVERNAARIFNADDLFFVTNGTSTSNKMVWHATVAPGDVVVVDRNCHVSILHAITMTGAIPVFLPPTRNNLGIIGPIPQDEFRWENIEKKIRAHPFARNVKTKPRILTLTQSTYDGVLYNVDTIKEMLGTRIDTLHFDEAWLPHAAFHEFYRGMHAIGKDRPRSKDAMIFSTQSTHKLLAGLSQASQILVQDSETRQLDRFRFNEAYLMHTSTSPQYAIIASCDVAAAMMEPPGGTALVEESIMEALDFRRAMRKVDEEFGDSWWFKVWGPDRLAEEGIGNRNDWVLRANERWHGFGSLATGFNMLDPIKATVLTPGLDVEGDFADPGIPAGDRHQVPGRARRHRREDRAVFVLHHVHDRHHQGALEHAADRAAAVQGRLRQECPAVAGTARVRAGVPALREDRAARAVRRDPRHLPRQRHRSPDHRDVRVESRTRDEAGRCVRPDGAPRDRARRDRRPRRPRDEHAADALSAGHPAADSRRAIQQADRQVPAVRARLQRALSRASTPTSTAWSRTRSTGASAISSTASRAPR
jgi:arginine/lysine/ornithine decarboxylase